MEWGMACMECYNKYLGGRKGWRLPTVEELASLADPNELNPSLPNGHPFSNIFGWGYWSSTTLTYDAADSWYVFFGDANVYFYEKTNSEFRVWCVRGGFGHDAY